MFPRRLSPPPPSSRSFLADFVPLFAFVLFLFVFVMSPGAEQSAAPENSSRTDLDDVIEAFAQLDKLEDFNRVGAKVKPIFASKEKIICELVLEPEHLNSKGTLHGGFTASLTDIVTARALGTTVKDVGMASVELAVSYLLPVKLGDTIEITATVLKCGRNIAFTEAEFRRKSDGKLCAKGKHTVAMMPYQKPVDGKIIQF